MKRPRLFARDFKLKFALKLCLLTVAGMAVVTLLLYLITAKSLGGSYGEAIYTINDLKINIFPLIFASSYSIFVLVVITAAMALISVFFSHKIAGPMFRIEKSMEAIGSGDLTVQTRFRGNDQLIALSEEINKMARSLNHVVRKGGDALEYVEKSEQRLRELLDDEKATDKDLMYALGELKAGIEEFKRATSALKTK